MNRPYSRIAHSSVRWTLSPRPQWRCRIRKRRRVRRRLFRGRSRILKAAVVLGLVALAAFGAYAFLRGRRGDARLARLQAAERAFRAEDYGKARLLAAAYLEEHGEDPGVRYMLGLAETRSGREDQGLVDIRRALELDPKLVPAAIFLADRALRARDFPEALRLARRALSAARESEEAPARFLLGTLLARPELLDVGGAVDQLERAVRSGLSEPKAARALITLGGLYRIRDSSIPGPSSADESRAAFGRAAALLRKLLGAEPDNGAYRLQLAGVEFELEEYGSALGTLAGAPGSEGGDPEVGLLRWKCLVKLGRTDEADASLARLLASDPPPGVLHGAVSFYHRVGRSDLANELVRRSLELHPHDPAFLEDRARLLFGKGDMDGVRSLVAKALESDPANRTARLLEAELEIAGCGSPEETLTRLRDLAREEAAPARMRLRLAGMLLDSPLGDPERSAKTREAEELLTTWDGEAQLSGEDRDLLQLLRARLALGKGWASEARASLADLIRRRPTNAQAHLLMALVCEATGDHHGQVQALDAAMALTRRTPELLLMRATALLQAGAQPDLARRDAEEAISLGSDTVKAQILVARSHLAENPPAMELARERLLRAAAIPGEGAEARLFLARVHLNRGEREEAREQVDCALGESTDPAVRLEATALLAELRSDPETGTLTPEARATYEDYIRLTPEPTPARLRYAEALLREGDTRAARENAEAALRRAPDDVSVLVLLYEILEKEGSLEEAARLVRRLGEIAPRSAACTYLEGRLALVRGETKKAASTLARALELDPGRAVVAYHLARARRLLGDLEGARQAVYTSIRLDPRNVEARMLLADIAFDQGRALLDDPSAGGRAEGIEYLRSSLAANPGHLGSLAHLVQALVVGGGGAEPQEIAEVRRHVEELIRRIESRPGTAGDPGAAVSLAGCYRLRSALACRRRDWPTLLDSCRREVALRPEDGSARYRLALALSLSGESERAIETILDARQRAPGSREILAALSEMLIRAGRPLEALPHLEEWTSAHPEDGSASLLLGRTLLAAGRTEEALAAFRRALALNPDLLEAAEYVTDLLVRDGRFEEAEAALRDLLSRTSLSGEIDFILGRVLLQRDFASEDGKLALERALAAGFEDPQYRAGCTVLLLRVLASRKDWSAADAVGREFGRWQRGLPPMPETSPVRRLSAEATMLHGIAVHHRGEAHRAEAAYRRALTLRPGYGPAENSLAALLIESGRVGANDEALRLAEALVERRPEVGAYRDTLGSALAAAGRWEAALEEYDRAISLLAAGSEAATSELNRSALRESVARTRLRKARALKSLDRIEEARDALRRAVEGMPEIEKDPEYREVSRLIGE